MDSNEPHVITRLLLRIGTGDQSASEELWTLVYQELHQMARVRVNDNTPLSDLQPTVLVGEVYLRLMGGGEATFENRRHFFGAAGRAMYQIIIDDARYRGRRKRNNGAQTVSMNDQTVAVEYDSDFLIDLDRAMQQLTVVREDLVTLVELRLFVGLTVEEIADIQGIDRKTVMNRWQVARGLLQRFLDDQG